MAQPRLRADIWVAAYLRRLGLENIPAYVVAHGDDSAGAVMVKCATLDGQATLWWREWDFETDTRPFVQAAQGSERDIDARIARDRSTDPDLWVIEIEERSGRTLLDDI